MLSETRMNEIAKIVDDKGSVSVQELMKEFGASESTIRRDLSTLHKDERLIKVHGGAIAIEKKVTTEDDDIDLRHELNREDKIRIAQYAAGLIVDNDFIYLDAGTTTELMTDYIDNKSITIVTNGISHAKKLASKGIRTYLLGGLMKASTEAVVGEEAVLSLDKYHFTKGFFGVNGITFDEGYSTPEVMEALLKKRAMKCSKQVYILSDQSKFDCISSVKFGDFKKGIIITTGLKNANYKNYKNILEV